MPDNYNDLFSVEVDVQSFKRSLDDMLTAYESFIKGLSAETRAGLGQGVAGNLGAGLKDLSSTLLEFRKDFTSTIAQLDTNINRFIEAIFDKNTSGIKKKVQDALDENEKLQEAIRQNAKNNNLDPQQVVRTIDQGTVPTKAEKVRRDINFENERLLRQDLEAAKTTLSQIDKTFRDREIENLRASAKEEQEIQSALDKERAAALKQRARDEDALYKEKALREKQSASDSLTAAKQEHSFRADEAKKERERVSQVNETFRRREEAAEKQAAAERIKLQKDVAAEEARVAKEREAQIEQAYRNRTALEKQQVADSIKAAKEEAAFKSEQRKQEQRQAAETAELNRSLSAVRAQGELAATKLRAAQAGSPQEQQKILNEAAQQYSGIVQRLTQQLGALPPPTTPEALRLQKDLNQELNQARGALTGITNQLKQAEQQSQGFFSKMIGGFKNTLSLVIRFYATFAALQAAIDVIKFTIGAPFEILADGLKYMVGIEEAASDLQGVLATNVIFSKDLAENFKIASDVSKDLVQLLKQRAVASGSTFDSLNATFKALLQGGAFQTVKSLEELVTLAETFQLAIKAAGAGGLAAQGSIQEISKLFNGLPGDYNKFLALLKLTPAEWEKIVKGAKSNRDLLDQLLPRIQNYADQVKIAELNQARLAKAFGELIDRIGGEGSKPLFNFITEQLKAAVDFIEKNFFKLEALVESLSRSIVILGQELTSSVESGTSALNILGTAFINVNKEILKAISLLSTFIGISKDIIDTVAVKSRSEEDELKLQEAAKKRFEEFKKTGDFSLFFTDLEKGPISRISDRVNDLLTDIAKIESSATEALKTFNRPVLNEAELQKAKTELKDLAKFRQDLVTGFQSTTASIINQDIKAATAVGNKTEVARLKAILDSKTAALDSSLEEVDRKIAEISFKITGSNVLRETFGAVGAPKPKAKKESTKEDRDALRELLEEFRLAREEFNEGAQDIREKEDELRLSLREQISERSKTYQEAAVEISGSINSEIRQLDKLRTTVDEVAENVKNKIKLKIVDPTVEKEGLQKVDKELRQFRIQQQKADFALKKIEARSERDAAKERLAISIENTDQRFRVEEEFIRNQQDLLGVARESGVFTEREYFDQVEALRKQQYSVDVARLNNRIALEKANTTERIKLENELALLQEKNTSADIKGSKQTDLLLEREAQLARDYATALAQVNIQSQQALLTTIQSLRPGNGYNDILAQSIELRAKELDLLEDNLRTQRDIAIAKNGETEETRRLNLQLQDLQNNRAELFNQSIRDINSGTAGVFSRQARLEAAGTIEARRLNFAAQEARLRRDAFISSLGPGGIQTGNQLLQVAQLDKEVEEAAKAAKKFRIEVFDKELKNFGKQFRTRVLNDFFGQGFSEAFRDASTGVGKFSVGLEAGVNALSNVVNAITSIQQGVQQGGLLGGVGAGLTNLGGPVAGLLSKLLPGVGAIPIAGQFAQALGPVLSIVGSLFTAAAKRIGEDIKRSFAATVENYQNGNTSLIETLNVLERQRTDAILRLSGKKGGQKELEPILKEFDNQIRQLRDTQKQIITDFDDALNVLRSSSETLSDINRKWQDINNQVKEYIGAGGDAAKAQEFLSLQLAKIRQDAANQLAQAEQDAIQEALRLNDLLKQRKELLDDFAKKEFEVLTRTAIERRKSTVVSAGEELASLRKQRDEQLANLDDQIRLSNIRVERQKDIFNLELDITALRRRDEELTLAALDAQLQKLRDLQSIVNSISVGPNGLLNSSLLQPANVSVSIDITGMPATEAGLEIVDTIQTELNRRFRMVPVAA